jgi:hypothetical protein
MFFYKALHGFYDLNVEDFVSFVTHGRTRLSSNSTVVLKTPYCKTTTFQASFFNRIVKIWNSICKVATRSSFTSVTTFKTFLINHYNELLLNVFLCKFDLVLVTVVKARLHVTTGRICMIDVTK